AEGPAMGYGTYGSRSLAVGGIAVHRACAKVVDKARKLAAHMLEASEDDVVFDQGKFHVKGAPDKSKAMGEVAFASYGMGLPEGMEHGLEAVAYFDPPNLVWPFGSHICVVEVDPDTGSVALDSTVTPSPTNELGVKGIGEAGTIAASPAVINAICDALSPFGIKHVDMPASPDRLWKQIQSARGKSDDGKEARK